MRCCSLAMKGSPQCVRVLEFDRKHRFALEMLLSELNSTVDTFVLVRARTRVHKHTPIASEVTNSPKQQ